MLSLAPVPRWPLPNARPRRPPTHADRNAARSHPHGNLRALLPGLQAMGELESRRTDLSGKERITEQRICLPRTAGTWKGPAALLCRGLRYIVVILGTSFLRYCRSHSAKFPAGIRTEVRCLQRADPCGLCDNSAAAWIRWGSGSPEASSALAS